MREFAEFQRGQRRERRRLEHHAIAGGQCGRRFPASDGEGKIPRHNRRDHAHRLAQGEIEPAPRNRDGLSAEPGDRAGVILEHARTQRCFITGVADRLADVERFELCDFFNVFAQLTSDVEENFGAFARREVAPTGFPRALPGLDRSIHVRGVRCGDLNERLRRRRIDQRGVAAGGGVAKTAVEKKLGRQIHACD